VDGACLTAASAAPGTFTAHLVRTTLERTAFAEYSVGRAVNLERALPRRATRWADTWCRATWTGWAR
jgi:riboflavin synthase alpha subunit